MIYGNYFDGGSFELTLGDSFALTLGDSFIVGFFY